MTLQHIIGIKAGSSIFQNETCFETVADLLVPLVGQATQIYFVVSALKGRTDRTISDIGESEREILNEALQGRMTNAAQKWNNSIVAAQLVTPENYSVRQLTAALQQRGVDAIGIHHGRRYPLIGVDDGNYLYATPDIEASQRQIPRYDAQIVVVPGFGVRNTRGEIMCTGRGSSDLTLAQLGTIVEMHEIVYWKDTAGYLRNPQKPEEGFYDTIAREEVEARGAKVLERRVLRAYEPPIRITGQGMLNGGTIILPYRV
ncbi:MAG: hypothetical protein WC254_02595 [Candidatus Woesearchaeota archaeon]|jgi:aspartokinase